MSNTNQSMTIMDFINLASKKGVDIYIRPAVSEPGGVSIQVGHKNNFGTFKNGITISKYRLDFTHIPIDTILKQLINDMGVELEDV